MPADNITRAIKKGTGELEGVQYEELVYEGIGADGALFLCEVVTDNRNRTIAEVRKVFDKNHGQIGTAARPPGPSSRRASFASSRTPPAKRSSSKPRSARGAENLELVGDQWVVTTARNDLDSVRDAIATARHQRGRGGARVHPQQSESRGRRADAEKLIQLYEALDDHDDIQNVFSDFELSEQALAEMA